MAFGLRMRALPVMVLLALSCAVTSARSQPRFLLNVKVDGAWRLAGYDNLDECEVGLLLAARYQAAAGILVTGQGMRTLTDPEFRRLRLLWRGSMFGVHPRVRCPEHRGRQQVCHFECLRVAPAAGGGAGAAAALGVTAGAGEAGEAGGPAVVPAAAAAAALPAARNAAAATPAQRLFVLSDPRPAPLQVQDEPPQLIVPTAMPLPHPVGPVAPRALEQVVREQGREPSTGSDDDDDEGDNRSVQVEVTRSPARPLREPTSDPTAQGIVQPALNLTLRIPPIHPPPPPSPLSPTLWRHAFPDASGGSASSQ
jgi:hypothetical protein